MSAVPIDFDEAERLLLEADFESVEAVWSSSNYVFAAQLCRDGQRFAAIYKPLRGESPLWDFPAGLYRREVASYRLARLLGWDFIPPTIARDGPHGEGSLQVYVQHDPRSHYFVQRERPELVPQLQRMAVFDFLANNADRKGGHCLLDADGRVWGIDQGLCLHESYKMRTVIWDWAGEPIRSRWLTDVEEAALAIAARDDRAGPFLDLLTAAEADALLSRADKLLRTRRFPTPGPHRHYPWPLV